MGRDAIGGSTKQHGSKIAAAEKCPPHYPRIDGRAKVHGTIDVVKKTSPCPNNVEVRVVMIPKMIRGFMELIEVKNIVPRFSWSKGTASQIIGCFLLTKRFYRISGGNYKLFQVACRDLPAAAQTRRGAGSRDWLALPGLKLLHEVAWLMTGCGVVGRHDSRKAIRAKPNK